MSFLKLLVAATVASSVLSAKSSCNLSCSEGSTCYATLTEAMDCLASIPFNENWSTSALDVFTESLQNFGFGALYHSTGPPYSINLGVMEELAATQEMVDNNEFANDLDYQEHVQTIFQKTIDAHTRYHKPACYNAVFVQPFAFDMRIVQSTDSEDSLANEPEVFLMRNEYTHEYAKLFPEAALDSVLDKKIILVNGVEVTTEVSQWGDSHETRSNNRGIRFNAAIRSYLYRDAMSVNIGDLTGDLTVTLEDGSTYSLPWMAIYTEGLADVNKCSATSSTELTKEVSASPYNRQVPTGPAHSNIDLLQAPQRLLKSELLSDRPDREVIVAPDSEYYVSCFVQTVHGVDAKKADVSRVLVMKVASFSPSGATYMDAWAGFLGEAEQCLSVDFDMVVVDVMQNGGGYVCLGLRLIELLVEDYENDHTKVQMRYDLPHSSLMTSYIETVNAPNPYPDPDAVEQILNPDTQESYNNGEEYYYPGRKVVQGGVESQRTNIFTLDCREAEAMPSNGFKPAKFMPPEKLIMLTDGTCGSTCAAFTKIPQEAGKATFVGAGGIWGDSMDVSSFAGGFVCNPDYLTNIATWSNTTFPQFATDQRWQFGWAAWYSQKLPSRPAQFTEQDPDYREAFWGFPHPSINPSVTTAMVSSLYDRVISSTIGRLAIE